MKEELVEKNNETPPPSASSMIQVKIEDNSRSLETVESPEIKSVTQNVNHHLKFFELSAKTGEGMEPWYAWLKEQN